MQKIVASILLLAFLGQTFNQSIYYFDYLVDKAAYAKNCINKARPQMNCNGQCQLMKKIQEQEKNQPQPPEMKLAGKFEIISSKDKSAVTHPGPAMTNRDYSLRNSGSPIDQPTDIFHPPGA